MDSRRRRAAACRDNDHTARDLIYMKHEVFDYTKEQRFAVVKKLDKIDRWRCNFSRLYKDRADAEKEALRLTGLKKVKFYIIEIQRITSGEDVAENDAQKVDNHAEKG